MTDKSQLHNLSSKLQELQRSFPNLNQPLPHHEKALLHQDAHEFLVTLLSRLDTELTAQEAVDLTGQTLISNLFHGIWRTVFRCQCGAINGFDSANVGVFALEVVASTLMGCLIASFTSEQINDRPCGHCESPEAALFPHTRHMRLSRPPRYLILHLIRYKKGQVQNADGTQSEFKAEKLKDRVKVPVNLKLDDRCLEKPFSLIKYRLTALISHSGTIDGGHFTADVMTKGKRYHCDDMAIQQVHVQRVLTHQPYMLFYRRMD
jgi:ubiquitin C-terminal hydrolase